MVDPGGDAAEIRLELAGLGARCAAILITHGHWDHLGGVAELAEGTGAPVHMAEDERALLENVNDYAPPTVRLRPYTAGRAAPGRRDAGARRDHVRDAARARPFACPPRVRAEGSLFSGDVLFAGSVGRTDLPGADWDAARVVDRDASRPLPAGDGRLSGPRARDDARAELAANPFLAELRAARR